MPEEIIIHIHRHSEEGWSYNVWTDEEKYLLDDDAEDGGICTSTIKNALNMAKDCAESLLNNPKSPMYLNQLNDMPKEFRNK